MYRILNLNNAYNEGARKMDLLLFMKKAFKEMGGKETVLCDGNQIT